MKNLLVLARTFAIYLAFSHLSALASFETVRSAAADWLSACPVFLRHSNTYTIASITATNVAQNSLYYVVTLVPSGYLLMSDTTDPASVICFSDTGVPVLDGSPQNALLPLLSRSNTVSLRTTPPKTSTPDVVTPGSGDYNSDPNIYGPFLTDGGPLIHPDLAEPYNEIHWNQTDPYNLYCPLVSPPAPSSLASALDAGTSVYSPAPNPGPAPPPDRSGLHRYTGCVPAAVAQVMRYYAWPAAGIPVNTYYTYLDRGIDRRAYATAFSYPLKWDNMLTSYSADDPTADDVALLMFSLGVIAHAHYADQTGVIVPYDQPADIFFNAALYLYYNLTHTIPYDYSGNWIAPVIDAMRAGQPVFAITDNHCLVLDGWYTQNGISMFHVNMGWGGANNGWMDLVGINYGGSLHPFNGFILGFLPTRLPVVSPLAGSVANGSAVNLNWTFPIAASNSVQAFQIEERYLERLGDVSQWAGASANLVMSGFALEQADILGSVYKVVSDTNITEGSLTSGDPFVCTSNSSVNVSYTYPPGTDLIVSCEVSTNNASTWESIGLLPPGDIFWWPFETRSFSADVSRYAGQIVQVRLNFRGRDKNLEVQTIGTSQIETFGNWHGLSGMLPSTARSGSVTADHTGPVQFGVAVQLDGKWADPQSTASYQITDSSYHPSAIPTINSGPSNTVAVAGFPVLFTVNAVGTSPGGFGSESLSYRWRKDSVDLTDGPEITGSQTPTLKIAAAQMSHEGLYSVVVSDVAGSATSAPASLIVTNPVPVVLVPPQGQTLSPGQTIQLNVTALGGLPLSYQWRRNGQAISTGTKTTFAISNALPADSGTYDVVVTNPAGVATSAVAQVTVAYSLAPPGLAWLKGSVDGIIPYANATAVDGEGNVYMTGRFYQQASFGRTNIVTTQQGSLFFVAKFDPAGSNVWVTLASGGDYSTGIALAVDALGTSYVGVRITGAFQFQGTNLIASAGSDECLIKLDPQGKVLWIAQIKSKMVAAEEESGISLVSSGGCFLVTSFSGTTATIGNIVLNRVGEYEDLLLARFSSSGTLLWARQIPEALGYGAASDSRDNVYITGAFSGPGLVGNIYYGQQAGNCICTAKYDSTGSLEWFNLGAVQSLAFDQGNGICVDQAGDCYVAGQFDGQVRFGTNLFTAQGHNNVALVKYTPQGDLIWAKQIIVTTNSWNGQGTFGLKPRLALNLDGGCIMAGLFGGTVTLGDLILTGATNYADCYVAAFDPSGRGIWAVGSTGGHIDYEFTPAVDSAGDIFVAGRFWSCDFTLAGARPENCGQIYVGKFSTTQLPQITRQPADVLAPIGATAQFSVAASGNSGLSYRWRKNGVDLQNSIHVAGSATQILSVSNVQGSDAAIYTVYVSNLAGSAVSFPATLTITDAMPQIVIEPHHLTAIGGQSPQFKAAALWISPSSYQWLFNGAVILGATNESIRISNVSAAAAGTYSVVALASGQSYLSTGATLDVLSPPEITSHPVGRTTSVGSNVTFCVSARGTPPLYYQWQLEGAAIPDATMSCLTLHDVMGNQRGDYRVLVRNFGSPVMSSNAPLILFGPVAVKAGPGGTVTPSLDGQELRLGSNYSIVAHPSSGFSFDRWTDGTGAVLGTGTNLLFTMEQGLSLRANFRDIIQPSFRIVSPANGQVFTQAVVKVTGKASDNVGISNIWFKMNDQPWLQANGTTSWAFSPTLTVGSNTVLVFARDLAGNASTTNSLRLVFAPMLPLVVITNGHGLTTPNLPWVQLGTLKTITAVPASGNLFTGWSGTIESKSPSLTFSMQSNLVLQANFVPNPFLPEEGTFNGLFLNTNDVTEASSGFFTLALTKSGAFTGKIMTSGSTYRLPTTKFDPGGQVHFTVPTKLNTMTFNLQLDLNDPANQQINGAVSDGTWTAGLTADRAVFNASANKAVNYMGRFTLAIAGRADASTSPGGLGWATLSISPAGLIAMKGSLADGTAMSQSVSVSKDGRWPFYAAYAAPSAGNGGAVFGWVSFGNLPATALGGTLAWFRPAGQKPSVYQGGFTNLAVPVTGSAYNSANQPLLALTDGQVTLDGGNLAFPISNQISLASDNSIALTAAPENTNKLALKITKTTGVISGTFANPSSPKQNIKVNGVLLQNQTSAAGYFLGSSQSGAFTLERP